MKPKYIIGIIIIVTLLIYAGMSFKSNLRRYVSLEEAKHMHSTVQVKGQRVPGSELYDHDSKTFNFKMTDESGQVFQVVFHGVKPSNFDNAKEVVAVGKFHDGVFKADQILVKCPSKYEAEMAKGEQS
ncbi:MAG: cytochrome c maturation protein CcmE [Calditrichaeota bacterium]|nr:MAG: cytochrome c maturation protein CcmE [Calditrichota bacterium]